MAGTLSNLYDYSVHFTVMARLIYAGWLSTMKSDFPDPHNNLKFTVPPPPSQLQKNIYIVLLLLGSPGKSEVWLNELLHPWFHCRPGHYIHVSAGYIRVSSLTDGYICNILYVCFS